MNRLNSLFEEDMEMQDAIEDLEDITDDSDGMIIDVVESHYNKDDGLHLFSEAVEEDPELAKYAAMLTQDDEEEKELISAELEDDAIDAAISDEDLAAAENTIAKD